jgi:transposase InsO family protein
MKDVGIKRELTTPYNPQQNGVVERKNRTIMQTVKTMIHDQDLPMHLWAEAARTAMYVQNRLSHSALGFKTHEEMFSGKKPEVTNLKIFGCQYLYTFLKRREPSWTLQERREYLLHIVRSPRPSKFIYQVTIILRSTEM